MEFSSNYKQVNEVAPQSVVDHLHRLFPTENVIHYPYMYSELADELFEEYPYEYLPTIGIEIELQHRQLHSWVDAYFQPGEKYDEIPPERQEPLNQVFDKIDADWQPRLEALKDAGIKIGSDSYAELILPPYHYNSSLRQLTDVLFAAQVLTTDGHHPMHITLGGIDFKGNELEAHYLARMVELLDGTTDFRIKDVMFTDKPHWTQKTKQGYLFRRPAELSGEATAGIELRALSARTPQQTARVLWRAQWLGAAVNAWLQATPEERENPYANATPITYSKALLIDSWNGMRQFFKDTYERNGINLDYQWKGPNDDPQVWTRHFVMCSHSLDNLEPKKVLYQMVDSSITDIEHSIAYRHNRILSY